MQNDSLVKMKDQLEYLFVRVIISEIKKQKMHANDVKPLCQEFLKEEPFSSIEDAHEKVDSFVAAHPQFSVLKEYANVYSDEDKIDEKLDIMRQHLKANNIDDALKVINQ